MSGKISFHKLLNSYDTRVDYLAWHLNVATPLAKINVLNTTHGRIYVNLVEAYAKDWQDVNFITNQSIYFTIDSIGLRLVKELLNE